MSSKWTCVRCAARLHIGEACVCAGGPTLARERSRDSVSAHIFDELKYKKPATLKDAEEAVSGGHFEGRKSLNYNKYNCNVKEDRKKIDEFYEKEDEKGRKIARRFMKKHKDSHVFVFKYADEDGEFFSILEYGGTFDDLPHVKSSYH